jgi:hypothetical protein
MGDMGKYAISEWIAGLGVYPLLVMLVPSITLFRKRGREVMVKQTASVLHAIIVFLATASAMAIVAYELSDLLLIPVLLVIGGAAYLLRKRVFPYRLTCPECGRRHAIFSGDFRNVYVMDDNLCNECRERLNPPQRSAAQERVVEPAPDDGLEPDDEPEWDGTLDDEDYKDDE